MTRKASSAQTSIWRSAGSNSTGSNTCTDPCSRITCSARRSPWQSRTKPRATRSSSRPRRECRNATANRCAAASSGAPEQRGVRQQGAEVLADGGGDGLRVETALRCLRRGQVKLHEPPCHGPHGSFVRVAAAHHRGKRLIGGETPHLDDVLGSVVPRPSELPAARGLGQRPHPQVEVGREPASEPDLLLAHLAATLGGPVVEKREDDRLAQLVRAVAGEEHPADMGLDHLDARRPVGIERRGAHGVLRRCGHNSSSTCSAASSTAPGCPPSSAQRAVADPCRRSRKSSVCNGSWWNRSSRSASARCAKARASERLE